MVATLLEYYVINGDRSKRIDYENTVVENQSEIDLHKAYLMDLHSSEMHKDKDGKTIPFDVLFTIKQPWGGKLHT